MSGIRKLLETKSNGLNVRIYEYDIDNEISLNRLKDFLSNKIKSSKVHDMGQYGLQYYTSKNMKPDFVEKFNKRLEEICIPMKHPLPQFDVRRERVTEWMAQYLLEQEYGCVFYNEADKRMNISPVEIDKHTAGIDVPGILIQGDDIKFVVCEVKASEDKKIPCSSAKDLKEDIQKAIDNKEERTTKEIWQYIWGMRQVNVVDETFEKIILFLTHLIADEKENLAKHIMFFPVLLRNNDRIIDDLDVGDYKDFKLHDVESQNVESIVAVFKNSFKTFSNDIYTEAIGDKS